MPNTNKHGSPLDPQPQEFVSPQKPEPAALARLLDEWMQGDAAEQRETFETLRRFLDENRPEGYKLFS
jgi:hypothetical protein